MVCDATRVIPYRAELERDKTDLENPIDLDCLPDEHLTIILSFALHNQDLSTIRNINLTCKRFRRVALECPFQLWAAFLFELSQTTLFNSTIVMNPSLYNKLGNFELKPHVIDHIYRITQNAGKPITPIYTVFKVDFHAVLNRSHEMAIRTKPELNLKEQSECLYYLIEQLLRKCPWRADLMVSTSPTLEKECPDERLRRMALKSKALIQKIQPGNPLSLESFQQILDHNIIGASYCPTNKFNVAGRLVWHYFNDTHFRDHAVMTNFDTALQMIRSAKVIWELNNLLEILFKSPLSKHHPSLKKLLSCALQTNILSLGTILRNLGSEVEAPTEREKYLQKFCKQKAEKIKMRNAKVKAVSD